MRRPVQMGALALMFSIAAAGLPGAAAAQVETCVTEDPINIVSGDGTTIVATLSIPTSRPEPIPALLSAHSWGGSRGDKCIYDEQYAVMSWDARGWPASGGEIDFHSPAGGVEDVSALIDYLAGRPEVKLDAAGDPRVGIIGSSYGGAIALNAAAFEHRIDAVVADDTWGNPVDDLAPDGAYRIGWLGAFYDAGVARGGNYPPEYEETIAIAQAREPMSTELIAWWTERATTTHSGLITAPTMLQQPATDTLFPLDGALTNYKNIKAAGTPVKLLVYCGGHLACPYVDSGRGDSGAWLKRYLIAPKTITGKQVAWVAQDGNYYGAPKWPLPNTRQVATKPVSGTLTSGGSGGDTSRTGRPAPASELGTGAVRTVIRKVTEKGAVFGYPKVRLVGKVTLGESGFLYLELSDLNRDGETRVIDSMTTPVAVTGSFDKTIPLRAVAWRLDRGHKLQLEISAGSAQFAGPSSDRYTVSVTATAKLPISPPEALRP